MSLDSIPQGPLDEAERWPEILQPYHKAGILLDYIYPNNEDLRTVPDDAPEDLKPFLHILARYLAMPCIVDKWANTPKDEVERKAWRRSLTKTKKEKEARSKYEANKFRINTINGPLAVLDTLNTHFPQVRIYIKGRHLGDIEEASQYYGNQIREIWSKKFDPRFGDRTKDLARANAAKLAVLEEFIELIKTVFDGCVAQVPPFTN